MHAYVLQTTYTIESIRVWKSLDRIHLKKRPKFPRGVSPSLLDIAGRILILAYHFTIVVKYKMVKEAAPHDRSWGFIGIWGTRILFFHLCAALANI